MKSSYQLIVALHSSLNFCRSGSALIRYNHVREWNWPTQNRRHRLISFTAVVWNWWVVPEWGVWKTWSGENEEFVFLWKILNRGQNSVKLFFYHGTNREENCVWNCLEMANFSRVKDKPSHCHETHINPGGYIRFFWLGCAAGTLLAYNKSSSGEFCDLIVD